MSRLGKVAVAGAWFFALGSLVMLAAVIVSNWPRVISYQLLASDTHAGFGFDYRGVAGTVLLWLEALTVLAAIVLSVLRAPALRRFGHAVLLAWCGLWLFNALYLFATGWQAWYVWIPFSAIVAVLLACTLYRALRAWPAGAQAA